MANKSSPTSSTMDNLIDSNGRQIQSCSIELNCNTLSDNGEAETIVSSTEQTSIERNLDPKCANNKDYASNVMATMPNKSIDEHRNSAQSHVVIGTANVSSNEHKSATIESQHHSKSSDKIKLNDKGKINIFFFFHLIRKFRNIV